MTSNTALAERLENARMFSDRMVEIHDDLRNEIVAALKGVTQGRAEAEIARLREALAKAGPIHAGPVSGDLGRKYPDARQCVIEAFGLMVSGLILMMMITEVWS